MLLEKLIYNMKIKKYIFNKQSFPKITVAKFKNDAGIIGATIEKKQYM